MPSIEAAIKVHGKLTGDDLDAAAERLLHGAQECDGIEVGFPDWPEADEAVKRWPDKLELGPARGPGNRWRRLHWIGDD